MCVSFKHIVAALTLTQLACGAYAATWPSVPSRLELDTPYGHLHVSSSEYVYESRLMLDEHEIEPQVKGLLNIPYAFSSPDFHVALVSIDRGEKVCPVSYAWIKLSENGYSITPPFGSCSYQINVTAEGTTFSLLTPNTENPKLIDNYRYDGTTITQETLPADNSGQRIPHDERS